MPKTKVPQECECGCDSKTKGGRFLPGHDAKLKSQLLQAIKTGPARTAAKARNRMSELGWDNFLPQTEA